MDDIRQRCINCSMRLTHQRRRTLQDATEAMVNILRAWILPTPVSPENSLCFECFGMLQQASQDEAAQPPIFGHRSVCFACGISTLRGRTHPVHHDCPERHVIIRQTLPHLVPHLTRVCYTCWTTARRNVQRQIQQDVNRPVNDLNVEIEQEESPRVPVPPPLPQIVIPQPRGQEHVRIVSQTHRRALSTSRHCIFSTCVNVERLLVPIAVKEMLLRRYRFYVPPSARICRYHLENDCWDQLDSNNRDFTAAQVDQMLNMMERATLKTLDFSNINMMPPHLCHYWLCLTAAQFQELLSQMGTLHYEVPSASVALSIYLVKLRTGDSNERLSCLFEMPRSTLERYMAKARDCMSRHMAPLYLGLNHMTIVEVASRNKIIPEGLFGNPNLSNEVKPAIVICDATYVYVQKSSNYLFQKDTYSLHKYQNLVKPFMIVCCDGHILDCLGPYKATVNDATIMGNEFRDSNGAMRQYFREGDVFLLDRGFRDVVPQLLEYGYQAYMPETLSEGESQLTTLQANKSRCVTLWRWVVEVVNGRLKRDFKLFRQEFFNRAARHLMTDFRNGCALINKFHPLIEDKPEASQYLAIARQRLHMDNVLANTVRMENINRRRATFETIDAHHPHLNQFPRLTIDDLKKLALGTYQIKQARSYYGEHVRTNGTYALEINNEIEDDIPLILDYGVASLKLLELRVPAHVALGTRAQMSCRWELGPTDILYSVKWYKDGKEFFRHVPRDTEPRRKFPLPGVDVEKSSPNGANVTLYPAVLETGGRYRCEVSGERPLFPTVSDHSDMVIVALPDHGPTITGSRLRYQIGDRVQVNCTSGRSRPATRLAWYINGEPAPPPAVLPPTHEIHEDGLETTSLALDFKCLATIATVYWRSNEESVQGERLKGYSRSRELTEGSRADRVQAAGKPGSAAELTFATYLLISCVVIHMTCITQYISF